MTTRTFVHRSVAILAATGTAATLALLPSSGQAAVHVTYLAVASSDVDYIGPTVGGTCNLTGSDDVEATPSTFTHGSRAKKSSINAHYTSSDNSADRTTIKGTINSRMTVKKAHNDLRSFELKTGGSLKISHDVSGSACKVSGEAVAGTTSMVFTEKKKGTFTLTRDVKVPNSLSEFFLINATTGDPVVLDLSQSPGTSHATYTAKLKPGKYAIQAVAGLTAGGAFVLKSAQRTQKVSLKNDLRAVFTPKKH
jgi:hypothetical protein